MKESNMSDPGDIFDLLSNDNEENGKSRNQTGPLSEIS
jgi:hypothetical protein